MKMVESRSLKQIFGGGYNDFIRTKKFYRVCRGSKGSKKSKTTALDLMLKLMKYPEANLLVVRKVFGTLQQSCYTDLQWAIDRLGIGDYWECRVNPLSITHKKTGQMILFRGMDDPLKLASITVRKGYLCWVWIEEAYEITNEADFDKLMMSIRGYLPPETGLWKQVTLTFNPWSEHTWLKNRFWDNPPEKDKDQIFTKVTTFRCNEWLGPDDLFRYESMYQRNPRAARVICDGDWGISEGLVYEDWEEKEFDPYEIMKSPTVKPAFGLDFGYAISYNAFVAVLIDVGKRTLWVYDEMYEKGLSNIDIAKRLTLMGYAKEEIWADSAEPKSIYELQNGFTTEETDDNGEVVLRHWQLPRLRAALKGPDSLSNGIQNLQSYHMIIHPRCRNTIIELNNYCWDTDKDGNYTGKPIKDYDHMMDALRYALAKYFVKGRGIVSAIGSEDYKPTTIVNPSNRVAGTIETVGVAPALTSTRVCGAVPSDTDVNSNRVGFTIYRV